MDFTIITDLHSGVEDFSKGMPELGDREQQPEVGREDFEETSRFYSARLMGSRDKSPIEEKLPEVGTREVDECVCTSSTSSAPQHFPCLVGLFDTSLYFSFYFV